eukprot:SAG25_NODE_12_length_28061_cov_181.931795_13_plen_228_part_00
MAAEDELPPQQPMLEDASPTPAAVESGATSGTGDGGVGDQSSSDSSASEEERPPIAAIVAHRDTKGQPWDPVTTYYTVQYAGLDELGEDGEEEELPEDEVLLRAGKILREYRRGVAGAASTAASAAAEAASSAQGQAGAAQGSKKRARGAGEARGGGGVDRGRGGAGGGAWARVEGARGWRSWLRGAGGAARPDGESRLRQVAEDEDPEQASRVWRGRGGGRPRRVA